MNPPYKASPVPTVLYASEVPAPAQVFRSCALYVLAAAGLLTLLKVAVIDPDRHPGKANVAESPLWIPPSKELPRQSMIATLPRYWPFPLFA